MRIDRVRATPKDVLACCEREPYGGPHAYTTASYPLSQPYSGSDAYEHKLVDDIVYELDAAQIVVSEGDVDIGGNPSAEEQAEALENGGQQVINIVHSFRLQQTSFDKKQYLSHLKAYMKAVKEKLSQSDPERVPVFEKKAAEYAKKIIANFKDYEFFVGESLNDEG